MDEQRGGESEPDGLRRIHPSILKVLASTQANIHLPQSTRQSFRSLDRSLKAFLRSSNLPGLEYRLRLAGYNSLTDLLDADVETLCAHGFTPLMARRLLGALDEYIVRQLDRNEGIQQLPFQLVRKGQKIKSDPTERMKALPTFGKQNVKRQRNPEPHKMGKKRLSSSKGVKVVSQKQSVSYVRLMSEENLPNEPIFPYDVVVSGVGGEEEAGARDLAEEVPSPREDSIFSALGAASGGSQAERVGGVVDPMPFPQALQQEHAFCASECNERSLIPLDTREAPENSTPVTSREISTSESTDPVPAILGVGVAAGSRNKFRRSVPVFQEFYIPDQVDVANRWVNSEEMGKRMKRCNSIPADYRFHSSTSAMGPPLQTWCMMVRSYSCPASLAVPLSQLESTLIKLSMTQDLLEVVSALQWLCSSTKSSPAAREEVRERGGMEVIMDVLVSLCTNPRVVACCFKLVKYLTREGKYACMEPLLSYLL